MPTQPEPIPPFDPALSPLIELQQSAIELAAFGDTVSVAARDLSDRATAHLISAARGDQPDPRPLLRDHHRLLLGLDYLHAAERLLSGNLRVYTVDLGTVPRVTLPVALNQPRHLVAQLFAAAVAVHSACAHGKHRIDRIARAVRALTNDLLRLSNERPLTDTDLAELDTQIAELFHRRDCLSQTLVTLKAARDALRPPRVAQSDDDTPEQTPAAQSLPPADATLADAEQAAKGVL
ncbi:hypothetical protein L6R46_12210 [Myxococcota bacterium]|nr:hypothetical protein [Myxococcota bacterium]